MDVEILSRIQFAFTIMFHYIYPPFSIGLGLIMVICEGMYLKTDDKVYEDMARFWTKIFATTFSIGVATGIVMEFEFGTNWATYSRYVGDIFGSPLAAEGIFAFFLESGFLAVLIFGWNRVSKKMHFFATCMVALGSMMSAFWIVVANSWMQTPTAYEIVGTGLDARAEITDFWAMVFNPSSMVRYVHTVVGCLVQGAFLVISISAYYIIKNRHLDLAYRSLKIALGVALVTSLLQPAIGHEHANVVAKYQPAKLAAYEGLYETTDNAPMYIVGWTDPKTEQTYGIEVPGMLSFLIAFDFDHEVTGLKAYPKEDWPNVNLVFQTYHLMVGLGMLFIALSAYALFALKRKNLGQKKWLINALIFAVPLPVLANQAGWVSAEVGRQPWIVQDLLRTSDALSKAVKAEEVLFSLIMFTCIYLLLFLAWIYILNKEIKHGPDETATSYTHRKERLDVLDGQNEE